MQDTIDNIFSQYSNAIDQIIAGTVSVYSLYLLLLGVVVFALVLSSTFIYYNRYRIKRSKAERKWISDYILYEVSTLSDQENDRFLQRRWIQVLNCYIDLKHSIQLDRKITEKIQKYFSSHRLQKKIVQHSKTSNPYRQIEAAGYMAHLTGEIYQEALRGLFEKQPVFWVKIHIANALAEHRNADAIPIIIKSMYGAPESYQKSIRSIVTGFGVVFFRFVPELIHDPSPEIQKLLISFASEYPSKRLQTYLLKCAGSPDNEIALMAAKAVDRLYPELLDQELFLNSPNSWIRAIAVRSLANRRDDSTLSRLMTYLEVDNLAQPAIYSISQIIRLNPSSINSLISCFHDVQDDTLKRRYAICISQQLDHLLLKLLGPEKDNIRSLISEILDCGIYRETISFLSRNQHVALEAEIIGILKEKIRRDKALKRELKAYLPLPLLQKLRLHEEKFTAIKKPERVEWPKITTLYFLLALSLITVPLVHVVTYWGSGSNWSLKTHLTQYIIDFNYMLAYYATVVNGSYLLLLLFSLLGIRKQITSWKTKRKGFLFKKDILPSISIIAPAFCEEANIVESTNSLLNLAYPDYELIVVNDGSTDNTLSRLIEYYDLERVDRMIERRVDTMPTLGVYQNKSLPKLIVIDKINGGKADSLNVGINVSRKEYFCGIDADSFLEPDALLKIVAPILDSDKEGVAVGGNIFPVNGCRVKKGMLTRISIPRNWLGRFQNIEYMRAFMAGRIGWSYINCLMIISGALGLFKKDRVIQVGGYLTTQGRYQKNTVGEDMELVVRLTRFMRERAKAFRIHYAFNANCWTEVPESLRILSSQRNRWHRGLIDILFFHRRMLFNPAHGRIGWVAFPYFLVFEVIGPLLEFQGYIMVLAAGILGILSPEIVLILFTASILMGILISVISLLIAEKETEYYPLKDLFWLLLFAVIENFGFRQFMSIQRVLGYMSSLRKTGGWGKMTRKAVQLQS